jgi:Na+/H+ antiporter NhaD/arsenite permease-like protein
MTFIIIVFVLVYLGMLFGGIPGLRLDRAGVALLGALALMASGAVSNESAREAVDIPTIALLFGLMVVSAQMRLGGFYSAVTLRVATAKWAPGALLGVLMAVAAALSAVLTNDIICLAMTPLLLEACLRRGYNPLPQLLGLACAANIGSAATLIGNPQNILIGEALRLSFSAYALTALPAVLLSLGAAWGIIAWIYRRRWTVEVQPVQLDERPFNVWQTAKGLGAVAVVLAAFTFTDIARDHVALGAAAVMLISRRMHSREMVGLVDWHLLVLFVSLFIVNHAFEESGALEACMDAVRSTGIHLEQPGTLFALSVVLSNLVSNVPAVMLLLPAATHPDAGAILAIGSTLAGNLIVVASIANIIVVEQARMLGVSITWREHATVGVPVTISSLGIAAGLLYFPG